MEEYNIHDLVEVKSIVLKKPSFMSALKFHKYLLDTFPREWMNGWNDSSCKSYELLIPTIKER